jgi:hypothetical protein
MGLWHEKSQANITFVEVATLCLYIITSGRYHLLLRPSALTNSILVDKEKRSSRKIHLS